MEAEYTSRYAITFGQVGVLHIGSQEIGKIADHGFTVPELAEIKTQMIANYDINAHLVNLSEKLPEKQQQKNEAAVLYLPNAINLIFGNGMADKLFQEQQNTEYDKQYWSSQRQKVLNKRARYNLVFADFERQHSQDYKAFTVKDFKNIPALNEVREKLQNIFGPKAHKLNADGNHYYQQDTGIGFHGDSERKIIICLNLGKSSLIRYFWRLPKMHDNAIGPTDIKLHHGDIYIMSQKASGFDWRKTGRYRLVHAAGSQKYVNS